jgi:signal transduction histidine kinase
MGLSKFISANAEAIMRGFDAFAREQLPAAADMDFLALRDHAKQVLDAIALDMRQPQTKAEQREKSMGHAVKAEGLEDTAAEIHGFQRAAAGFNVKQTAAEYRALRASVLRLWFDSGPQLGREQVFEVVRFNEAMDEALAESTLYFANEVARMRNLFLGVLSHELRTPLSTIMASGQSLIVGARLKREMPGVAERVLRGGRRIESLLDDLLDYVRSGLGEGIRVSPVSLDMASVCDRIVSELRASHPSRTIDFTFHGDLACVCDEQRIAQAVSNLIGNALHYGGSSTPITVVANGDDASEVLLTVKNAGPPIPKETCESLFDPLVRGAGDGEGSNGYNLGLGLYIVREIVHAHGGTAHVASDAETGTVFTLRIPRHASPSTSAAFQGLRMN